MQLQKNKYLLSGIMRKKYINNNNEINWKNYPLTVTQKNNKLH